MQSICTWNMAIKQSNSLICKTAHNEVTQGVVKRYLMGYNFFCLTVYSIIILLNPKFSSVTTSHTHSYNYSIIHLVHIFKLLGTDVLATHIFLPE